MNLEPDEIAELTRRRRRDYNLLRCRSNDVDETKRSSLLLYDMARALVADRKANPLPATDDHRRAARGEGRRRATARGDDRRHDPPGPGGGDHRAGT